MTTRLNQGLLMLLDSMVTSLSEVFPEKRELGGALEKLKAADRQATLTELRAALAAQAAGLRGKDPQAIFAVFQGVQALQGVRMRELWADQGFAASRQSMWQYLSTMETYATLLERLPTSLLARVEKATEGMGSDLAGLDIGRLGAEILGPVTEEEREQMRGCSGELLQSLGGAVQALGGAGGLEAMLGAGGMQALLGGGLEGLMGGQGDLGALLCGLAGSGLAGKAPACLPEAPCGAKGSKGPSQ